MSTPFLYFFQKTCKFFFQYRKREIPSQNSPYYFPNYSWMLVMIRPNRVPESRFHIHLIATVKFVWAPAKRMRCTNIQAHQAIKPVSCGFILVLRTFIPSVVAHSYCHPLLNWLFTILSFILLQQLIYFF